MNENELLEGFSIEELQEREEFTAISGSQCCDNIVIVVKIPPL